MRDGDGKKVILLFGLIGLAMAALSVDGQSTSTSSGDIPSGSLPDVAGLRQREAAEPGFIAALLRVIQNAGMTPENGDKLTALISEESGFKPDALEPGDGGSGFLQWLPAEAPPYAGYTAEELRQMTGIEQLQAVANTLARAPGYKTDPAVAGGGWSTSLPDDAVVIQGGTSTYNFFHNYDVEGKGYVTAGDVRRHVYGRLNGVGRLYPS